MSTAPQEATGQELVGFNAQEAVATVQRLVPADHIERLEILAANITITDDESLARGNEVLRLVKEAQEQVDGFWDPKIQAAWTVHKMILSLAAPFRDKLKRLRTIVDGKIKARILQVEQERRDLERRLAEQLKADEDAKQAEANRLMAQGNVKEAKALLSEPAEPIAVISQEKIKLEGTMVKRPWRFRVRSFPDVVKAVYDGKIPIEALQLDEKIVQDNVTALKNKLNWPGIEPFEDIQLATSGRGKKPGFKGFGRSA